MSRSPDPPRIAAEFGARVRARRLELGLTQMRLAELSGLDLSFVSDSERGLRNVSLVIIVKLAKALEVDPADLVAGLQP